MLFAQFLPKSRDFLVLDPSLSRALAQNDKEIIKEYLTFKLFKDCKMIIYPHLFLKSKWVLVIANVILGTITVLDTQQNECNEDLMKVVNNYSSNHNFLSISILKPVNSLLVRNQMATCISDQTHNI